MAATTTIGERTTAHDPPRPLTEDEAYEHVATHALSDGGVGRVGLELESHLVDLDSPADRVPWSRACRAVADLPALAGGSVVTLEPGGQVELSGPPARDVAAAVEALGRDLAVVRAVLAERRLGLALLGADPARPAQRVDPRPRYEAMERHFDATSQGGAGRAMMCSTASLQVNLDAGPRHRWSDRVARAHLLGPVLVAVTACSPLIAGRSTGWRSTRQQVWGELDQTRCGPLGASSDPAREWADYALCAPVMLVRDAELYGAAPVLGHVPFRAWASGDVELGGRRPVLTDLGYHLTTLFPPTRLRGFLEVRCLDASPAWPAVAALVTALMDDERAGDLAAEACEPVAGRWTEAARDGLADEGVARAARRCVELAASVAPSSLAGGLEALGELVAGGRCPGDRLVDRADDVGPLAALVEQAGGNHA